MDTTMGIGLAELSTLLSGAGPWSVCTFAVTLAGCTALLAWLSADAVGLQLAVERGSGRAHQAAPAGTALRLTPPPCPCCHSAAIKPLVFGQPARGAVFGGRNHGRNEPRWICLSCQRRYGRPIAWLDRYGRPVQEPAPPSMASPASSQPLMPAAMMDALV